MITSADLERANEGLKTIPIHGKDYVMVTEKIRSFRRLCPMGQITTEVISLDDTNVVMKAVVSVDGFVISEGIAQENRNANLINKTSYIENCQTSAIGRALAFMGIGIDGSISSADELLNALVTQEKLKEKISKKEQKTLTNLVEKAGLNLEEALNGMELEDVTGEIYQDAVTRLNKLIEARNEKNGQS